MLQTVISTTSKSRWEPPDQLTVRAGGRGCGAGCCPGTDALRGPERDFGADAGLAPALAIDLERAVELAKALAHIEETNAYRIGAWSSNETDSIARHRQANHAVGARESDIKLVSTSFS